MKPNKQSASCNCTNSIRKFMLQHTDSYTTQHQWVITQSFAASDCHNMTGCGLHFTHDIVPLQLLLWCRGMLQHEFPVLYTSSCRGVNLVIIKFHTLLLEIWLFVHYIVVKCWTDRQAESTALCIRTGGPKTNVRALFMSLKIESIILFTKRQILTTNYVINAIHGQMNMKTGEDFKIKNSLVT